MDKTALVVEDHPLFRGALMHIVSNVFGTANVLAACSAEEGLSLAHNMNNLSMVLLDLGLPGLNGAEAVQSFRRKLPAAAIIVVSASEDRREAASALRAGAKAVVSKAVSTEVITAVVKRVLGGETLEAEWITDKGEQVVSDQTSSMLTPRQREIVILLAQGLSNKEISLRLNLAEVTVKLHITAIFKVFGVVNRTQASLAARRFGLHAPEEA